MSFAIYYDDHDLEVIRAALASPDLDATDQPEAGFWLSELGDIESHGLSLRPEDNEHTHEVNFSNARTLQEFRDFLIHLSDRYGNPNVRKLSEDMGRQSGARQNV